MIFGSTRQFLLFRRPTLFLMFWVFCQKWMNMFIWTRRDEFWQIQFFSITVLNLLKALLLTRLGANVFLEVSSNFVFEPFLTVCWLKISQRCWAFFSMLTYFYICKLFPSQTFWFEVNDESFVKITKHCMFFLLKLKKILSMSATETGTDVLLAELHYKSYYPS